MARVAVGIDARGFGVGWGGAGTGCAACSAAYCEFARGCSGAGNCTRARNSGDTRARACSGSARGA